MRFDYDIAVVGAGIVGLATAVSLLDRDPAMSLAIFERRGGPGLGQTGHNSGVIHSGIYYAPGSQKAQLCVDGAERMRRYCDDNSLPYRKTGKLIVATRLRELDALAELERRGIANGVHAQRLSADEIRAVEPACGGVEALHVRDTAITDFGAVSRHLAGDLGERGAALQFGAQVQTVASGGSGVTMMVDGRSVSARHAVICAGAQSDRLAVAAGASPDPRVIPFRGGYLSVRPSSAIRVKVPVYPVPDLALPFLGVHVTPTVDGRVLLGPSSLLWHSRTGRASWHDVKATATWPGLWRVLNTYRRVSLHEAAIFASRRLFARQARRLLPRLSHADVTAGPYGIRAQAVGRDGSLLDDFLFEDLPGVTHVRNAPSPAATAAFAIGDTLAVRTLDRMSSSK